jgi:VanZ family protein
VVWAGLISYLSTDSFAGGRTLAILRFLLESIVPGVTEGTLVLLHAGVRKLAHLTEYAVLGILVLRAIDEPNRPRAQNVFRAIAFCAAYAALDELHQRLVPSRTGAVSDVAIDAFGAVLGVALRAWAHPDEADRPFLRRSRSAAGGGTSSR